MRYGTASGVICIYGGAVMGIEEMTAPFPWSRYSRKLATKIGRPQFCGVLSESEIDPTKVRLVEGTAGSVESGNAVRLYWLVNRENGAIVDARFQVFGQSALIGAADAACGLLVGKNYDQATRISADLIDKELSDRNDQPAFPPETYPHLNLVLEAIEFASEQCRDLPLPSGYVAPPAPMDIGEVLEGGYPGWDELSLKQQVALIEEVLDREIRPYIALDAGGVVILDLLKGRELIIGYEGTCTSCYSAVGTTLSYIQQVLRAKIHPELKVTPDLEQINL